MNVASFPIIATDEYGKITAKNRAAYSHLPKIRVKSSLCNKASFLRNGDIVLSDTSSPFRYAVCLPTDTLSGLMKIYMFLPSLQNENARRDAESIDAERIFDIIKSRRNDALPVRVYSEIVAAFAAFDRGSSENGVVSDVAESAAILDKKLSSGFRALGYRASVTCTGEIVAQRYFKLNLYSFVYSVLTAAYIAMRLSKNGAADVVVDYNGITETINITATSKTDAKCPVDTRSAEDAIAFLVPELAVEMAIDKEFSIGAVPKTCTIHDSTLKLCIPVSVNTRQTVLSGITWISESDLIDRLFTSFKESSRKALRKK